MPKANTNQEEITPPHQLFQTLQPQIESTVRWACRCYRNVPDLAVIEDLAQEISLLLVNKDFYVLRSFEHKSSAKTWLQKLVLHRVGRYFKSQKLTVSLESQPHDFLPPEPAFQDEIVLFKERERLLDKAASKLTEKEKELWTLLRGGLTDIEIASQMMIQIRSVQRKKHTLLMKLKDSINFSRNFA